MSSPLSGGRRRRRPAQLVASVVLVLAPLVVGAAAYLTLASDDAGGGAPGLSIDVRHKPAARRPSAPAVALDRVDSFHLSLRRPPRSGLVFDVGSGDVLWRHDPMRVLPIASLTKVMTALIAVDRTQPSDPVRITQAALDYTGSGVGMLPKGRRVRAEALLNGMLIVSGNDAAIALADHIAGSERRFAALMNKRARRWGLKCTHFVSSDGLEAGDRSCARDLAVMTRLAMRKRRIRQIVRQSQVELKFPIKGGKLYLTGHNPLIRLGYPGTIGLKTGYTDKAGRCFVGVVRRGDHTLAVVLLNSFDPSKQAPKLLTAAFATLPR